MATACTKDSSVGYKTPSNLIGTILDIILVFQRKLTDNDAELVQGYVTQPANR